MAAAVGLVGFLAVLDGWALFRMPLLVLMLLVVVGALGGPGRGRTGAGAGLWANADDVGGALITVYGFPPLPREFPLALPLVLALALVSTLALSLMSTVFSVVRVRDGDDLGANSVLVQIIPSSPSAAGTTA